MTKKSEGTINYSELKTKTIEGAMSVKNVNIKSRPQPSSYKPSKSPSFFSKFFSCLGKPGTEDPLPVEQAPIVQKRETLHKRSNNDVQRLNVSCVTRQNSFLSNATTIQHAEDKKGQVVSFFTKIPLNRGAIIAANKNFLNAIINNDEKTMRDLLTSGMIRINAKTWEIPLDITESAGNTITTKYDAFPALVAINQSCMIGLQLICNQPDFKINNTSNGEFSAIILFSLFCNNKLAAEYILKLKAENTKPGSKLNLNIQSQEKGLAPMHLAAQKGYPDILEEILKYSDTKANIQTTNERYTPLHFATWEKNASSVEVLINSGKVDIFIPNKDGISPISIADKQAEDRDSTDGKKIKEIYQNYIANTFVINSADFAMDKINELMFHEQSVPLPGNFEGNPFLKEIKEKLKLIKFELSHMHFRHVYDNASDEKIILVYFDANKVFFNFYDYDTRTKEHFLFKDHFQFCPNSRKRISNIFDLSLSAEEIKEKCYILPKGFFASLFFQANSPAI